MFVYLWMCILLIDVCMGVCGEWVYVYSIDMCVFVCCMCVCVV